MNSLRADYRVPGIPKRGTIPPKGGDTRVESYRPRGGPALRVAYTLYSTSTKAAHCFGVNSLAFDPHTALLYSAGRDSCIHYWDVTHTNSVQRGSFTHHTDWVNDILMCEDNIVASCSSDTTVKLWRALTPNQVNEQEEENGHLIEDETNTPLCTLLKHTDYVKGIAYAKSTKQLSSVGLDSRICIWDIATATTITDTISIPEALSSLHQSSMYSVAMNDMGTLLATGSTDKVVQLWDPRTGKRQLKLMGHKDNIKALLLNADGTMCLSGSSDGTVRLWDIGQQRTVQTYTNFHSSPQHHHAASVWAIATDQSWKSLYAGRRDKSLIYTELATGCSSLICIEESPILKVVVPDPQEPTSLWVATTSPRIKKWSLKGVEASKVKHRSTRNSISAPDRSSLSLDAHRPVQMIPTATIEGRPGILRSEILPDRIKVLTADSQGGVELWDVTRGIQVQDFGHVPFEEKLKELQEGYGRMNVPNWFSVETKTGNVTIQLTHPQCFSAEIYAVDAGLPVTPASVEKVNMGGHMLRSLFDAWFTAKLKEEEDATREAEESKGKEKQSEPLEKAHASTSASSSDGTKEKNSNGKPASPKDASQQEPHQPYNKPLSPFLLPSLTALIISDEATGATLYRSNLTQTANAPDGVVPKWVSRFLLQNIMEARESFKMSFQLLPFDPKDLPKLPDGTSLNAHRAMKIRRALVHVVTKLNLQLPPQKDGPATSTIPAEDYIEILCNSQVLSPADDLASVQKYYCKPGTDVVLYYKRKQVWMEKKAEFKKQN